MDLCSQYYWSAIVDWYHSTDCHQTYPHATGES